MAAAAPDRRSRAVLAYWLALVVAGIAAQALLIANHATWTLPTDPVGVGTVFAVTYGLAGAMVLRRRPGHPLARLFLYVVTVALLSQLTGEYALFAFGSNSLLPLRVLAAWVSGWCFFLAFPVGLTLVFLLFPDGLDAGRRYRAIVIAALIGAALLVIGYMGSPGPITPGDRVGNLTLPLDNPTGFLSADLSGMVSTIGWALSGLALIGAVVSAVARLRHSTGERHQQMRWFAYFAAPVAPAFVVHFIIQGTGLQVVDLGFPVYYLVYLLGIPLATGIALLKYRLYDLDVVVSRALVYGSLAAVITAVYVAIAVGVGSLFGSGGQPNLGLSILATAIVSVGFQPLRERLQRLANRVVYGRLSTPYEVLSHFSAGVADSYSLDEVLPRMAQVVAEGTGARRVDVWLRSGSLLTNAVSWPAQASPRPPVPARDHQLLAGDGTARVVPVTHRGELLGAIGVEERVGDALTPVETSLLEHLANQAGLMLRNVGLTADLRARLDELRASQQRLVAAQDGERRRLERNLHDGAQQHLVALKVKLGLVELLASRDPAKAQLTLDQLAADTDEALETLRDLARGIFPPVLAEAGLAAALEIQAAKSTVPTVVDGSGLPRFPADVEAAVYFCILEALQNVQKYAAANRATVRLRSDGNELRFFVEDDGCGFDPATASRGSGLANMRDRLEALGGTIALRSSPGGGTVVEGRVAALTTAPVPLAQAVS